MNTLLQLLKLRRAWKNDLPKESVRLYRQISDEYITRHEFTKLGKLIVYIEKQSYSVENKLYKAVRESINKAKDVLADENNIPLLTIFNLLLCRVLKYNRIYGINKSFTPVHIENISDEIWSTDCSQYSWAVEKSPVTELFNNDLYAVIGLELKQYKLLYDRYKKNGNRAAQAYLLTLIATSNDDDEADVLDQLQQVMHDYADLPVAAEAAIAYYEMYNWKETSEDEENVLVAKNRCAEKRYQFLTESIKKWGKWYRIYELENKLSDLCSTSVSTKGRLKQVWFLNDSKHIELECRNVKHLSLIVYETSLTGWDILQINDDNKDELHSVLKQSKEVLRLEKNGGDIADYLYETHEFNLDSLPIGVYIIEVLVNDTHSTYIKQNVTNIVTIGNIQQHLSRFAVLNAQTGFPEKDATIRVADNYWREDDSYTEKKCNADGIAMVAYEGYDVFGYTPSDKAGCCGDLDKYWHRKFNESKNVVNILTDRQIYRPGQSIHIAVVAYSMSADKKMKTRKHVVDICIKDSKRKTWFEKKIITDEYGLGQLDFIIPEDVPTGRLWIEADDNEYYVRVEEYKRPTFEVALNPYKESYRADDTITITGKAQSFAGVPIADAKVNYKIIRRCASWWWFYSRYWSVEGDMYERNGEEIGSGECQTNDDGLFSFDIRLNMPRHKDDFDFYDFVIIADVVDNTGETHSAEMVLPLGRKEYLFACNLQRHKELHEECNYRVILTNSVGEEIQTDVRVQIDDELPLNIPANKEISVPKLSVGRHVLRVCYKEEIIEKEIFVVDKTALMPPIETNDWFYCSADRFTQNEPIYIQVGTSSANTYLLYTIQSDRVILEQGHVVASNGMLNRQFVYKEGYKYGIRICFAWVKEGVCHHAEFSLLPPKENLDLQLQWKTFRNRLEPGDHETWSLRVTQDGQPADANIIATLYDKSLEQLVPHSWQHFAPEIEWMLPRTRWETHDIRSNYIRYAENWHSHPKTGKGDIALPCVALSFSIGSCMDCCDTEGAFYNEEPDQPSVALRTNFAETAFFMPRLRTDENGEVVIDFDLPDTLTTWRFRGVAHTKEMHYGFLTDEVIAQKQVMLQPNLPRFMRVGDQTILSAKVTNMSDHSITGKVRIELKDAQTENVIFADMKEITLDSDKSENVNFCFKAQNEHSSYICTFTVVGKDFSDGEQHQIPVLTNMENVVVTRPFSQMDAGKFKVNTAALVPVTAIQPKLALDYTNHPFWVAYNALPTMVDEDAENAISVVAGLYCTQVALHVQNVVGRGRITDTGKERVVEKLINKLQSLQKSDGGFAWYDHMHSSDFLTAEVMMHLSRMVAITHSAQQVEKMMNHANTYLDQVMCSMVEEQKKRESLGKTPYFPNYICLQHMYSSALLKRELSKKTKEAYNYLVQLLKQDIHEQTIREKAMTAIILEYNGEHQKALLYAESLYQYTTYSQDKGRWYDTPRASYSWMSYKIPTHVIAMEALAALRADDKQTLDQMTVWLLQEKRTQKWDTPIDCVNAVHALLLSDYSNQAFDDESVQIYADGALIEADWEGIGQSVYAELSADTKTVIFDKQTQGLSWGFVSAAFSQPLQDVEAQGGDMILKREVIGDTSNLRVGDRIRVRLTCECARNFDMVEIHDVRAACMEPVNQLTCNDSFVHVAPHDTETIYSYLGLGIGTHSIETEYFLTRPGTYQLGLATSQCCYAPEFRATAPSEVIIVKEK